MLDLKYACALPAGHSGRHEWQGVPAAPSRDVVHPFRGHDGAPCLVMFGDQHCDRSECDEIHQYPPPADRRFVPQPTAHVDYGTRAGLARTDELPQRSPAGGKPCVCGTGDPAARLCVSPDFACPRGQLIQTARYLPTLDELQAQRGKVGE